MREVYRKEGRSLRYENGRVISVVEAGEAVEEGPLFRCAPSGAKVELDPIDPARVQRIAAEIGRLAAAPLRLERLIVSEGVASHSFGGSRWDERTLRVHAAIVWKSLRVLIDRADDDLSALSEIVAALPRAGAEREAPQRIRLRPAVAAALLPALVGVVPPNVELIQSGGGFDGKGAPIVEQRVAAAPWPNWYRPSYRVRPVRTPLNLRLRSSVEPAEGAMPVAVAILEPPAGLTMRVLCVDGAAVYPATVRVTRIESAARAAEWYPYAAGSFGAEMVL